MAQPTQERLAAQLEKPQQTSGNVGHAGSGTGPENSPHFENHEEDHVHHVAMTTYYAVFALLIFLLLITVGAWYIDQHVYSLGRLSTPVAMIIAVAKAVAIVLIFMHVKFSSRLVQIFACTGVAFVSIMFLLTFMDYFGRDMLPHPGVLTGETVPHYRVTSVGSAPNDQGTPADNMAPAMSVPTTPSVTTSPKIMGADIQVSQSAATLTAPAMNTGGILGGAANNSYGSAAQSQGIEPKPAVKAPAGLPMQPPPPAPSNAPTGMRKPPVKAPAEGRMQPPPPAPAMAMPRG